MTAVGGGNFSSPVTVYLEEPSEDSGPVVVIATVTVNLVVLTATFSLLVASVLGYKYWLVYTWQVLLCSETHIVNVRVLLLYSYPGLDNA